MGKPGSAAAKTLASPVRCQRAELPCKDVSGALEALLADGTDFETFFAQAPTMNPNRFLITGVICGHRVEEIEDPLMQKIRYLDKLVDELAKGKAMEKILRE